MGLLFHLWALVVPISAALGIAQGGAWLLAAPVITLLAHPIADRLLPRLRPEERLGGWPSELVLLSYPTLQTLLLVTALLRLASGMPEHLSPSSLSNWLGVIAMGASVGMMTGALGITIAHELIHRARGWQRGLGVWLLTQVLYGHFRIEHVYGHHLRVATFEDPASARPGETLYHFVPRSIAQGFLSALRLERTRARPWYQNRVLHYSVLQLSWLSLTFTIGGVPGLIFWMTQAFVAVVLLELINYIEHYGLVRERRPDGRYPPTTVAHSWDSNHRATNAVLFNLGRHSDHHLHPRKPCEDLVNPAGAPMLPWGYSTTMLWALLPPFYLRRMDARIQELRAQGHLTP